MALDAIIREGSSLGKLRRKGGDDIQLQSSIAAAILMSSPSMMNNFAVGSFFDWDWHIFRILFGKDDLDSFLVDRIVAACLYVF